MDCSINHLLNNEKLSWLFVSGKGGVGKTSNSCALGILFSQVRKNVLIVSTDPAHNISDSFNQKFSKTPTLVKGFNNLYAMEIDPGLSENSLHDDFKTNDDLFDSGKQVLSDLLDSFPGIDEAMSFAQVMKLVQDYKYSLVIFDTAPTGHTLRLLSFPFLLKDSLAKIISIKNKIFPLLDQLLPMMGMERNQFDSLNDKINDSLPIIEKVSEKLTDPNQTTFICVCIAEFLSLYETERLIQQLLTLNIDVNTIIVNQLVKDNGNCQLCKSRNETQEKYLAQIKDLYEDFHIIEIPLLEDEVRGIKTLKSLSTFLSKNNSDL